MTNYELIKDNAEEMAYALLEQEYCDSCPHNRGGLCTFDVEKEEESMYSACYDAAIKWLYDDGTEKVTEEQSKFIDELSRRLRIAEGVCYTAKGFLKHGNDPLGSVYLDLLQAKTKRWIEVKDDSSVTMVGWTSVKDRLPAYGDTVLAFIKHNYNNDGWRAYRVYEYTDHWVTMGNLCEVIAWRPLPEPPKEVSK